MKKYYDLQYIDPREIPSDQRQLTFGEKAVGLSFNPGGHPKVNSIKRKFADLIDELHSYKVAPNEEENPAADDMLNTAIRECQAAQMWAVKAVTWPY